MSRPVKHKYAINPLRRLRECLGKGSRDPILQKELSEIIGIPTNTIHAIEAGQRKLPDRVILQAMFATGSVWDKKQKRWLYSISKEPLTQQHYEEFKGKSKHRPEEANMLTKDLLDRTHELFNRVQDSHWVALYMRFQLFVDNCYRANRIDPAPFKVLVEPLPPSEALPGRHEYRCPTSL
jgi:hypothetical protein